MCGWTRGLSERQAGLACRRFYEFKKKVESTQITATGWEFAKCYKIVGHVVPIGSITAFDTLGRFFYHFCRVRNCRTLSCPAFYYSDHPFVEDRMKPYAVELDLREGITRRRFMWLAGMAAAGSPLAAPPTPSRGAPSS